MNLGNEIGEIATRLDEHVLQIRMHRPDRKNALHDAMYTRMAELLEAANTSTRVRVILLSGSQDCFSSGNDVSTFTTAEPGEDGQLPSTRFLTAIAHCEVPIVAAVNGPAIGVGTTMLLHCDFVIAGDHALLHTPFVQLGVCPEAGSSVLAPLRMGHLAAARLLLLGEKFSAQEALEHGLVTEVCGPGDYQGRAEEIARTLATLPPSSIRATKKLIRAPLLQAIDEAMEVENEAFAQCMQSHEFGEAITAFLERRAPDFSGTAS